MKFTQHYTVKWHDTDANRCIRPTQLMMYMQETANEQLADAGVSLDALRDEQGLGFLLSSISVEIHAPLHAGDKIDVQTWVCEGRGFSYNRCFCVKRGEEIVAEATSVWALMNLREKRLMRADEAPYDIEPEPMLVLDLPRRLRLPRAEEMETCGERRIVYSDIDYNGHMNNTHYPDLFCDFLPQILEKRVTGMMLSFVHEATFDHVLSVRRAASEDGYFFRTEDVGGVTCTEAYLRVASAEGEK
ncbi:MAG: hypothetical protein IJW30_05350 [Clostridia bacterium]|nr:hypothetical protein [Clostridia bacterium]